MKRAHLGCQEHRVEKTHCGAVTVRLGNALSQSHQGCKKHRVEMEQEQKVMR